MTFVFQMILVPKVDFFPQKRFVALTFLPQMTFVPKMTLVHQVTFVGNICSQVTFVPPEDFSY